VCKVVVAGKCLVRLWRFRLVDELVLAEPRGFCAGVVRAIDAVEDALRIYGPPIYVRRQIVHNPYVVADLESKGAVFVEEVQDTPVGSRLIFSAHGVPPEARVRAMERDLKIVDATCPLVTKVHVETERYARNGNSIVLIGHEGHEEVVGTMGEAPDRIKLVGSVEDAIAVDVDTSTNEVAVVTQTTLSVDDTAEILNALRRRFPQMKTPARADICFATQNRQDAVKLLAGEVDLVLVLGAENSSNSQRLKEVADATGCPAHLIPRVDGIDEAWLEGVKRIGITSGASTPESLVEEVLRYFRDRGVERIRTIQAVEENVQFAAARVSEAPKADRDAV
jgi:4-hydroxy-3-methylbut-2-enyl diphosphate reductase